MERRSAQTADVREVGDIMNSLPAGSVSQLVKTWV